eukprot:364924-Chlamydomonas_euryale.AAC.3
MAWHCKTWHGMRHAIVRRRCNMPAHHIGGQGGNVCIHCSGTYSAAHSVMMACTGLPNAALSCPVYAGCRSGPGSHTWGSSAGKKERRCRCRRSVQTRSR